MEINKKGGVGKEWLYSLSFIFALSILVFIFNGVFNYNLAPLFISLMPPGADGEAGINGINRWLLYWKFIPLLLLGSVLLYMFILTIKKTPTERYLE